MDRRLNERSSRWIDGRSSRIRRAGKLYGYTSAVGAIGQAMGITVRAPRHAHACVDVTEPAAAAAATTSSQELNANYYTRRNSSNSNVGSKQQYCLDSDWTRRPQTATRSRARGTVLFSARLLHLPEITTLLSQYVISAVVLSHERTGRGTMEAPLGTRTKAHSRNYAPSHATIPAVNGSTKVTFENFRYRSISTRLSFCCCSRRCNINLVQTSHAVRIRELLAWQLSDCGLCH